MWLLGFFSILFCLFICYFMSIALCDLTIILLGCPLLRKCGIVLTHSWMLNTSKLARLLLLARLSHISQRLVNQLCYLPRELLWKEEGCFSTLFLHLLAKFFVKSVMTWCNTSCVLVHHHVITYFEDMWRTELCLLCPYMNKLTTER